MLRRSLFFTFAMGLVDLGDDENGDDDDDDDNDDNDDLVEC